MAFLLSPQLLRCWTVREGDVIVRNVLKEVNLIFRQSESCGDRVDWRVSPSFVEETSVAIEGIEVVEIRRRSEPVETTDFEVGPLGISARSWSIHHADLQSGIHCK